MTVTIIETTTDAQCVEAALAWCREFGFDGDQLPKGCRGDSRMCPLARATRMIVGCSTAFGKDWVEAGLPPRVVEFRRRFDLGLFAEYDLEANDG